LVQQNRVHIVCKVAKPVVHWIEWGASEMFAQRIDHKARHAIIAAVEIAKPGN